MKAWFYDQMYKRGAPWEMGPRDELVGLVASGVLTASELPRAIDLGCGSGANAIFLAEHGFEVTGVDFSTVALAKARAAATAAGVAERCAFVHADLTAATIPGVDGPFDLLVDYGALDDLRGDSRAAMARLIRTLSRPGSRFLLWCFQAHRRDLPWISFSGPSRVTAGLAPGEETVLFGDAFAIEPVRVPPSPPHCACYLMTARDAGGGLPGFVDPVAGLD